jgi:carboxylesterase type B
MKAKRAGTAAVLLTVALIGPALPGVGGAAWAAPVRVGTAADASAGAGVQHAGSLVVRTDKGLVRGVRAAGVDSFLGLRYAAAPVGALRWRPPRPAAPWPGVLAADRYGNRCPALASTNGPRSETEDCLFLNVQRPAGARPGARLPVYFWIHGGGLINGSSNQHDGSKIVSEAGVVVVTINYRLGVFGFLGHPALTAEAGESGNYGLDDQQAALRWVRRNIAAFGGDPRQVTIGGESAGGWSVCAHLTSPGSRGLFVRAMIQSGSCVTTTEAAAEARGTSLAGTVGCTDAATAAGCLRAVPPGRLLDAFGSGAPMFVRGTTELPVDPRVAVHSGQFARVPVVDGANRDEGRTFAAGFIGSTQDQYTATVRGIFGANADAVLAHYPWPADADRFTAAYLVGAIFTDSGFVAGIGGCTVRSLTTDLARFTTTYGYEFDHRTGPGLSPQPAGYVWGAGHAAELAYLWPSFDNGMPIAPTFDAAERRLADDMVRYWGAFVRTGHPQVRGQARWPRYAPTRAVLSLRAGGHSTAISDGAYTAEHQCAFWNSLPTA